MQALALHAGSLPLLQMTMICMEHVYCQDQSRLNRRSCGKARLVLSLQSGEAALSRNALESSRWITMGEELGIELGNGSSYRTHKTMLARQ